MTTGIKTPSNYYLNLVTDFPPRPITNEAELIATQQRINHILDTRQLTQDDQDYLRVLSMLIYEYEEKYEIMPELRDGEFLQALMDESHLQISDFLDIFENEATIIDILEERKRLNTQDHQKIINKYYKNDQSSTS